MSAVGAVERLEPWEVVDGVEFLGFRSVLELGETVVDAGDAAEEVAAGEGEGAALELRRFLG